MGEIKGSNKNAEQYDPANKGLNKTLDYSLSGKNYPDDLKQPMTTTPKKMPSKRDTRLREFQARSQRKQGNGEKLMGINNHNFIHQDLTPK